MTLHRLLLPAVLGCCLTGLTAQPLPHTLLWRITGKEGHRPSYLYGTMHLTDERLFNLGDSLYAAIRESDGLAIEVDPNNLGSFILEEAEKQMTNMQSVRDILPEDDYRKYGPLLAKRLGKPLTSITSQDILHEKNKWIRESYRTGKMPTFLDAWLFDIARRQHKWTGGVEDMADQTGLIHDIVDKSDILDLVADEAGGGESLLQKLTGAYLRQDLDALDSLIGAKDQQDLALVKRNHKMAMRMDSLSALRSMVFAVGAAHLPGQEGLISLLRGEGYRVEPVFSSRKIKSADYPVPELPESWETVTDDNGFYRAEMPGKPSDMNISGIVKMKAFIDIFKGMGYVTMAVRSAYSAGVTDSVTRAAADRMFRKGAKITSTPFMLEGARGRLYSGLDEDGYKKGYLVAKGGVIYMAFGTATKESESNRERIDHFLTSFHLLDPKQGGEAGIKLQWFTDTALAFTVLVPAAPTVYTGIADKNWKSRTWLSMDMANGNVFFFGAHAVHPGHYIENDSTLFAGMKKGVRAQLIRVDEDTAWLAKGQLIEEIAGKMGEPQMEMTTRYILRGNRWYTLLATYPPSGRTPAVDSFFSSFTELEYPAHDWRRTISGDSVFAAWAPGPFVLSNESSPESDTYTYTSYDSTRSESYDIVTYRLGPYYWSTGDSAFWAQRIQTKMGNTDILLDKKPVANGEAQGWEWTKKQAGSHLYYRERLLLHGDRLYALVVNAPEDQLHTRENDRFFEDFRFLVPVTGNPYLHDKAEGLLKDLFAEDSATAEKALSALRGAPFEKRHLPLLYRRMLEPAPLDRRDSTFPRVNNGITAAIRNLHDTGSFRFAMEHYSAVPDSNAFIRENLLELMTEPDSAHYAGLFHWLRNSPPAEALPYSFISGLKDSLTLTARFFPELLPLLADSVQRPVIIGLTSQLLDSNYLAVRLLQPYRETLLAYAESRARKLAVSADNYLAYDEKFVRVTGRFNDAKSNSLLFRFLASKDFDVRLEAVDALLQNHRAVDPGALSSLAADNGYRLSLFRLLTKAGRMDLFPAAWRTQRAMGQAEVSAATADALEDDEGEGKVIITFLREKLVRREGGAKRFLFYTVRKGKKTWLACAGGYDPDPAKLSTDDIRAFILTDAPYNESRLAGQMSTLLKQYDSGDE